MYNHEDFGLDVEVRIPGPEAIGPMIVDCATRQLEEMRLPGIREAVAKARDRIINERVKALVVEQLETLLDAPYTPTNEYGRPTGEERTLRGDITLEVQRLLTKPCGNRGYRGMGRTLLEELIQEEVGRQVEREFKQALDEGKAAIAAALKEKGAEVLSATIARMAEGRS